jgi:hypothetical protein
VDSSWKIRFAYLLCSLSKKKATWKEEQYKDLSGFLGNPVTEQYGDKHTLVILPAATIKGGGTDFNPFDASAYTNGLSNYVTTESKIELFIDQAPAAKIKVMGLTAWSDDLGSASVCSSFQPMMAQNHGAAYTPNSSEGEAF